MIALFAVSIDAIEPGGVIHQNSPAAPAATANAGITYLKPAIVCDLFHGVDNCVTAFVSAAFEWCVYLCLCLCCDASRWMWLVMMP